MACCLDTDHDIHPIGRRLPQPHAGITSAPTSWRIRGYRTDISGCVNRAHVRIGKRGAHVLGFQAPAGGLHRTLSHYPVLRVATLLSAALLLQTDISLVLRVIYLLTFTSPPRPFITLL